MRKPKTQNKKSLKDKIKTEWDLSLIYKSEKELDKHLDRIERAYRSFAKKYSKKNFTSTNAKLLSTLKDYEGLLKFAPSTPYHYLYLKNSIDSNDKKTQAKLNQTGERLSKVFNEVIFFELEVGKISVRRQKEILKDKRFSYFSYLLENIFKKAEHSLTEPEEKILNLKSQPSRGLWVQGGKKSRNKLTLSYDGREVPISEAIKMLSGDIPIKKRRLLWSKIISELKKVSDFSESEMNAIVLDKKIDDELRGYQKPYSATVLGYQNTEEEVEELVSEVRKAFSISREFYQMKSKILGLKEMEYSDRLAHIGKINKKFGFKESANLISASFGEVDSRFRGLFERMLHNGQIDVYPKKGKGGGAYCSGDLKRPTYILLNHTDDFDSMNTLAHEMGHAIHYEMSKKQPLIYQQFTISVAEVASTFFENVLFWRAFETLNEKEKIVALAGKIDRKIATIFRQIAFFNFELDLHNIIRSKGFLSHEELAELLRKHLKDYCGPAVNVFLDDAYSFIYTPHFRSMFYVYAYAYGELVSSALYARYLENPSYIKKIVGFLSAGGSRSPYDIFKDIGIDTRDPNFWKEGLLEIRREVKELKKLLD